MVRLHDDEEPVGDKGSAKSGDALVDDRDCVLQVAQEASDVGALSKTRPIAYERHDEAEPLVSYAPNRSRLGGEAHHE